MNMLDNVASPTLSLQHQSPRAATYLFHTFNQSSFAKSKYTDNITGVANSGSCAAASHVRICSE